MPAGAGAVVRFRSCHSGRQRSAGLLRRRPARDSSGGTRSRTNLPGLHNPAGRRRHPQRVLDCSRTVDVVHLAAHAAAHENRFASAIGLHGYSAADSALTLARVLAEGDFRRTSTVVLATCDSGTHAFTGLGRPQYRSLDGAFLARGARSILSTLWPLADASSPAFMSVFHHVLASAAARLLLTGRP
ncbi:CHAT domain-containing protein [Streptacidiphilus monticola]